MYINLHVRPFFSDTNSRIDQGTVAMSTGGADGILVWSEPGSDITVTPDDSHLKGEEEAFGDETAAQFAFELDDTDLNAFPAWVPPAAGADPTGQQKWVPICTRNTQPRKADQFIEV